MNTHWAPMKQSAILDAVRLTQMIALTLIAKSLSHVKGKQNMSPQNMPIWHKDYQKLVIFQK